MGSGTSWAQRENPPPNYRREAVAAQPHFPFGSIALGHGVGLRLHPVIRLLWPASERPGECPFLDPRASLVATYRNTLEPPMNAASYNAALHRNPLVSLLAELHDAAQHELVIGHVVSANLVTTGVNPHVIGFWRKHLHLWHFVNANDAVRASRMQMRGSQFRPCSNDRSFVDARSPRGRVPHVGEASNPSP